MKEKLFNKFKLNNINTYGSCGLILSQVSLPQRTVVFLPLLVEVEVLMMMMIMMMMVLVDLWDFLSHLSHHCHYQHYHHHSVQQD